MPNDGEADRSVRIVGANAQADESVFVVNNMVVAGAPSPGDVPVVQGDGSLAWGAGGGGASHIFQLQGSVSGVGVPLAGGNEGSLVLVEGNKNRLAFTTLPVTVGAGATFIVAIHAPTFSAGTLHLDYAEMDVGNPTGTQLKAVASNGVALTSGELLTQVVFDGGDQITQVGADLTLSLDQMIVASTAGGLYAVSVDLEFTATGLVA